LEHPHIVGLYRYGEANDLLYMAMQYIEGADLDTVLETYHADGEFMPPEDISRIIDEVCQALDYAHGKEVIHRDIKPSNIILNQDGRAIITDFGLALLTEFGTKGEIFGSPHYIAPEQAISSAGVVPQSDLYSVGVILYQMFTGQVPFDAETAVDVAMLHMSEAPRPPREIRTDINPEVETVILKLLAKEPDARYSNGAAVTEALQQAMQGVKPPETSSRAVQVSVPDRIAAEMAEHPLPPIPPAPPESDWHEPEDEQSSASPSEVSDKPVHKHPLPPVPAPVAARASLQTQRMAAPEPDESVDYPAESTAAKTAKKKSSAKKRRPILYMALLGALTGLVIVLIIVAALALFFYFR
jgi:serine/threonine protein kinase